MALHRRERAESMWTLLLILFLMMGTLTALVVLSACALAGYCDDEQQELSQRDNPASPSVLRLDTNPAAAK